MERDMVQATNKVGNSIAELAKFCYELTQYGDDAFFEYLPDLNAIAITAYKGNFYTKSNNTPVFSCLFDLTLNGLSLEGENISVGKIKLLIVQALGNIH